MWAADRRTAITPPPAVLPLVAAYASPDGAAYKDWAYAGNDPTTPVTVSAPAQGTEWFSIDTGYTCVPVDISSSGTPIDTGSFFVPYFTGSGTAPKDDGTAGPFDMGDNYVVFGDEFRYAWVGVNEAKTAAYPLARVGQRPRPAHPDLARQAQRHRTLGAVMGEMPGTSVESWEVEE